MYGKLLASCRSGTHKKHRLLLPPLLLQYLIDRFVIEICVEIMHLHRICAIVIHRIHRNPLAEIGLKTVNPHIQQMLQFS